MTRLTVDAALSGKLYELAQAVEVCDPSGKVLGRFVPAPDVSKWEPMSSEADEHELDRRERSTDWFTTADVLTRLERP